MYVHDKDESPALFWKSSESLEVTVTGIAFHTVAAACMKVQLPATVWDQCSELEGTHYSCSRSNKIRPVY